MVLGEGRAPLFTRDGAHLLFVRGGEIWIAEVTPRETAHLLVTDRGAAHSLTLSPDGSLLSFCEYPHGSPRARAQLYCPVRLSCALAALPRAPQPRAILRPHSLRTADISPGCGAALAKLPSSPRTACPLTHGRSNGPRPAMALPVPQRRGHSFRRRPVSLAACCHTWQRDSRASSLSPRITWCSTARRDGWTHLYELDWGFGTAAAPADPGSVRGRGCGGALRRSGAARQLCSGPGSGDSGISCSSCMHPLLCGE